MHRLLSTIVVLAWGLWFGAIVMVFVTVTSLFSTFADQRQIAGAAAAGVFRRFEVFELILAPVGLLAALLLRRWAANRSFATVVAAFLALAAVGACASHFYLTPRIDELRRQGVPSSSEQFKSLHGQSSMVYASQAVVLLAAGLLLPGAISTRRGTSSATAPA
jgi:hypothetical protein